MEDLNKLHIVSKDLEMKISEMRYDITSQLEAIVQKIEELEERPVVAPMPDFELPHIPNISEDEFEEMKFYMKTMRSDNATNQASLTQIMAALGGKVDVITYDKGIGKKIDRDDVYLLLEKFAMEDDRVKKIQVDIGQLFKKFDHLQEKFEKKLNRLKRELDLTSIQKLLRSKADDNEVKKEFENFDFKSKTTADSVNSIKKDLDGMFTSIRKITDVISL